MPLSCGYRRTFPRTMGRQGAADAAVDSAGAAITVPFGEPDEGGGGAGGDRVTERKERREACPPGPPPPPGLLPPASAPHPSPPPPLIQARLRPSSRPVPAPLVPSRIVLGASPRSTLFQVSTSICAPDPEDEGRFRYIERYCLSFVKIGNCHLL